MRQNYSQLSATTTFFPIYLCNVALRGPKEIEEVLLFLYWLQHFDTNFTSALEIIQVLIQLSSLINWFLILKHLYYLEVSWTPNTNYSLDLLCDFMYKSLLQTLIEWIKQFVNIQVVNVQSFLNILIAS